MSETLYATFNDYKMAEKAVGALLDHGLNKDCVTLIANQDDKDHQSHAEEGITTTTGADAGSGAAKGAGFGLAVGALGALASLLIPGYGIVIGSGALATALGAAAGTTAGGAVAGGIAGFLQDQGVDEQASLDYEEAVKRGGALVELNLPADEDLDSVKAEGILNKYNATNIRRGGTGTSARPIASSTMGTTGSATNMAGTTGSAVNRGDRNWEDYDADFRSDASTRFSGRKYEDVQPGYRYGYDLANDSRYKDRDWNNIENDARGGWRHEGKWDDMKDAVRHGYERVRSSFHHR